MTNIARILKNYEKDTKLYSPLFGEGTFVGIEDEMFIIVETKYSRYRFDEYGKLSCYPAGDMNNGECLLFPSRYHRTWEDWKASVEPKFKVGDWIVRNNGSSDVPIQIYNLKKDRYLVTNMLGSKGEVMLTSQDKWHLWTIEDAKDGDVLVDEDTNTIGIFENTYGICWHSKIYCGKLTCTMVYHHGGSHEIKFTKPATKEQRDLLFAKMREAGYEWDTEKKELRKIIEPKFKVGDEIVWTEPKGSTPAEPVKIIQLIDKERLYMVDRPDGVGYVAYDMQDYYKLAPEPHYDIANFHEGMPVLARDYDEEDWCYVQFSHYSKTSDIGHFNAGGAHWYQCIPFEGNKYLLGTTDPCDECYINWQMD